MSDRTDERTTERERSVGDAGDFDLQEYKDLANDREFQTGGEGEGESESGSERRGALDELRDFGWFSSDESTSAGGGQRSGIRSRLGRLFSPRGFLLRTGVLAAGLFAGGFVPLLPGLIAGILGLVVAGFAIGLVESNRSYLETGLAGLLVGGVAALLNHLVLTIAGIGAPIVMTGAIGGLVGAVLGLYLGRDLKAGLTKEI
jgi:hypothetical protein